MLWCLMARGELVKDAGQVTAGEEIRARVARGEIRAVVKQSVTEEGCAARKRNDGNALRSRELWQREGIRDCGCASRSRSPTSAQDDRML